MLTVLIGGVTGYMVIQGWSFLDSLYMTVITLSTVEYKEVQQLTVAGKWFTIALIGGGIGIISIAIAMFSSLILEGDAGNYIRRRKMEKKINSLKNHIIICGLEELGEEVVRKFNKTEKFSGINP